MIDEFLQGASHVEVADIDGDGAFDVVATAYNASRVMWYRNPTIEQADFDGDGRLTASDIDLMCAAISGGENPNEFDLTQEGLVNSSDFNRLVNELMSSMVGDSNLDGRFDSSDLVAIFSAGQYEDGTVGNSGWATGDWNCDGEFDTADLVAAFTLGDYQR